MTPVSRRDRPNPLPDLRAALALDHGDVVLALQVEPELGPIAEIAAKPHRRIGRYRTAPIDDVGDTAGRHTEIEREPIGAQRARGDLSPQEAARVCDRGHGLSSVIVDDLDVVGVTLAKHEADSPACIHPHGPLPFALGFELVQPDAFERAEIVQRLGNVQGEQQVNGRVKIQAPELVRPLPLPHLAGRGIAP